MKFTLRSYAPADFETLYQIDQQCFEKEIAYSRRDMRAYLKFPGADCVVAEAERGEIAAFCITARRRHFGYVITMDVMAEFRRQGLAARLLGEMESRLAAAGVSEVWLETATDNAAAIAFWQKCGYRKRGIREGYYPDGRDAFTMRKLLKDETIDAPVM